MFNETATLPPPDRTRLHGGPLGLVAFQLTWDGGDRPSSRIGIELQRLLGTQFRELRVLTPAVNSAFSIELGVGGLATSSSEAQKGWRLAAQDESIAISCFPDTAIIEARRYDGWANAFRPLIAATVQFVKALLHADVETRTGLRYINALSSPEADAGDYWLNDRVTPTLLGVLPDEALGRFVASSAQRTVLTLGDDISASIGVAIRPDTVHAGRVAIVLDIDVSRQGPREFSPDAVMATVDILNTVALQVFQRFVTPAYLSQLRSAE